MRACRGFTLIEIMVVMVIVGIMVGMISLVASGSRDQRELENQARKLVAILQMASEEAVLQNVEIGLSIDEAGYQFRGFDETNRDWVELPQGFLKPGAFEASLNVDLTGVGDGLKLRPREDDAASPRMPGESEPATFLPRILLLSSGETTPFDIRLALKTAPDRVWRVYSDGFEAPMLEEPSSDDAE